MKKHAICRLGVLVTILAVVSSVHAASTGSISDFQGDVHVVHPDGTRTRVSFRPFPINEGDTIETGSDGEAVVVDQDGYVVHVLPDSSLDADSSLNSTKTGTPVGTLIIRDSSNPPANIGCRGCIPRYLTNYVTTSGICGVKGTQFFLTDNPDTGSMVISVLEGQVVADSVDYQQLPDSFFSDPLQKSINTLLLDEVYGLVDDPDEAIDLLGENTSTLIEAGYWASFTVGGGPPAVLPGLAPSHANLAFSLPCPEPGTAEFGLICLGIVAARRRRYRINYRDTSRCG